MRVIASLWLLSACAPDGTLAPEQAPPPVSIEETFLSERIPADLLLIIDNSGSMAEEQAVLAGDVGSLASAMALLGADAHIGITTTDADDPATTGRLREINGLVWADGDTPGLTGWLSQAVRVGINGSPDEQGLHVMATALTDAGALADNAGFLRADADLHVLTITDEADWSPPRGYATGLSMLKSGGFDSFFHLYAGPSNGGSCFAEKPRGYSAVHRRIGGVQRNICDANAGFLGAVAHELALRSSGVAFELAADPDPATIVVTVDDGAGPTMLGATDFIFDADTRTVLLQVPVADGATVRVRYAP